MTEYPSIAALGPGQVLGTLYNSLPIKICGLTLSHLLFVLPTAPLAVLLYFVQKVTGDYFVLTNRSVQIWAARSRRRISTADLNDIDDIEIVQSPGQVFYKAGDIVLKDKSGKTLQTLKGIPDPASFCNAIRRMSESRRMVKSALDTIAARG